MKTVARPTPINEYGTKTVNRRRPGISKTKNAAAKPEPASPGRVPGCELASGDIDDS